MQNKTLPRYLHGTSGGISVELLSYRTTYASFQHCRVFPRGWPPGLLETFESTVRKACPHHLNAGPARLLLPRCEYGRVVWGDQCLGWCAGLQLGLPRCRQSFSAEVFRLLSACVRSSESPLKQLVVLKRQFSRNKCEAGTSITRKYSSFLRLVLFGTMRIWLICRSSVALVPAG